MSLDNIQLQPFLVQRLYKDLLIDEGVEKKEITPVENLNFLGANKKNIVVIVNDPDATHLDDEDLNFLVGIISACKLTMADLAIINYSHNPTLTYKLLMEKFKPEKIIFFGMDPHSLDFPLTFPNYQLQKYNHQQYLSAPSLQELATDKEKKKQLWECLKQMFDLKV